MIRTRQAEDHRPDPPPAPPRRAPLAATAPARRSPCRSAPAVSARGAPAPAPDGSAPPTRGPRRHLVVRPGEVAAARVLDHLAGLPVQVEVLVQASPARRSAPATPRPAVAAARGGVRSRGSRRAPTRWPTPAPRAGAASRPPRSTPRSSSSAPKGSTTPSTSRNSSGALILTTVCQCPQNASAGGGSRHRALPCARPEPPRAPQQPLAHCVVPTACQSSALASLSAGSCPRAVMWEQGPVILS